MEDMSHNLPNYFKFVVENITVVAAPLLKVYYWEQMEIDKFNEYLATEKTNIEHTFKMPPQQINSKPLKVIFWIRNCSEMVVELKLKRIKNCACERKQTRVGFNQFQLLYCCPHRQMIKILNDYIRMKPGDLVAMSQIYFSFLFGEQKLTYDINCNDGRTIRINFLLDIITFEPQKCVLTTELAPTDMREFRCYVQPIWIRNISMNQVAFKFHSRVRGLKILNPNLVVPRLSVWPLLVEYRPTDVHNELEIKVLCNNLRGKFIVKADGVLDTNIPEPTIPVRDYESDNFLYVIYPNKLSFTLEQSEQRSLMVAVHNYDQKCVEFKWQDIYKYFEITYDPSIFRLKPHHSKLCMVIVKALDKPILIRRIPVILEVHRILDKSTKLAKELLYEIESIDDPKWAEGSYFQHVHLQIDIKIKLKEELIDLKWKQPLASPRQSVKKTRTTTIFERLFWEYLSKSNFMRENKTKDTYTYKEVLEIGSELMESSKPPSVTKKDILMMLNQLTAEACSEISRNWCFIPHDLYYNDN